MLLDTTRRLASATALTALTGFTLGLAGCGADSIPSSNQDGAAQLSPAQAVVASYEDLQGQSYTMESTITIDGLTFVQATSEVEGEATRATQDLHLSVLLDATGAEGLEDPELADLVGAMFGDMRTESILVDGVLYLQITGGMLSAMAAQYGQDAWFTMNLAEHADLDEVFAEIGGFDLASQTERLLTDLTDVRETSPGVYTGTLSADSEPMQAIVGSMGTGADPALIEAIEVVITVDEQGLLRSMEMTLPEIEGVSMHIVSTIVEIGGQYDIKAPESENVYPFEELIGATG